MSIDVDEARQIILDRLAEGESLLAICEDEGLPCARTVQRWQNDDPEFDVAITRARESGFLLRAEKAVADAKKADDASKGRLAFDAERWFLGKLSNAFSDKVRNEHSGPNGQPIATTGKLNVEGLSDEQLRALASIRIQPD
jgi:hypothetical protein